MALQQSRSNSTPKFWWASMDNGGVIGGGEGVLGGAAAGLHGVLGRAAVGSFEKPVGAKERDAQRIERAELRGAVMQRRQGRHDGRVRLEFGQQNDAGVDVA